MDALEQRHFYIPTLMTLVRQKNQTAISETKSIEKIGKSLVVKTDAGAFMKGNNPFAHFD